MKQDNDNAVDLLLRSLGRGEDDLWTGAGSQGGAAEHLDADELNLYAEGVLPAPAQARYTNHLADCQTCRRLVAGLAQAAGPTVLRDTSPQSGGAGFWQRFGVLFSMPVLRYAVPAVALTGVLAIALVALREQRQDLVAHNQTPTAVSNQPRDSAGMVVPSVSPAVAPRDVIDANKPSDLADKRGDVSGLPASVPGSKAGGIATDGSSAQDSAAAPQVAGVATAQPVYAPEPVPPPAPPKAYSESDTKTVVRKEDYLEREAAKRNQDEGVAFSKDDSPTHGPARSRSASGGGRRDADVLAENRTASAKEKKEAAEEAETQTVSGRTFRRQGNAWIDTAYQSSRGATSVGRGSEQFRALMADEPGLRAIVQRLGGEVIVVWKGRAYRFR